MNIIDILREEHVIILEFINHLSTAEQKIGLKKNPPVEFFEKALNFCRNFADQYHHYKEEYHLFGLFAQKKSIVDVEIYLLKSQHERCRNLINQMATALDGYSNNPDFAISTIREILVIYIEIMYSHIDIEENVVFPVVEKELTEENTQILIEEFKRFEVQAGGNSMLVNRNLVNELEQLL